MTKYIASAVLMTILIAGNAYSTMIMADGTALLKIFYTMNDHEGRRAVLKGKILSFSAKEFLDKDDLYGKAQDRNKATVRLYDVEGIHEGDTLYVVNEKNLIVAKMNVKVKFKSRSFGDMLVGYGNFRLASVGDRVVREESEDVSRYAYIHKARGDYYENIGERGNAIEQYKTALGLDRNDPAARLALGNIYMKEGLEQFALKEFQEAYRNINRLNDREDKYMLLRNIAEIRYREVYESFIPESLKEGYRDEAIKVCREAIRVYPGSERMHYYLGIFYYRSPNPDDRKAKDYFLKVLELNPGHAGALECLSELYYRHDNMEKARLYAEKAIASEGDNPRARAILRKIEDRQQMK